MNPFANSPLTGLEQQIADLQSAGRHFYQRGWSVGTSSNYSCVVQQEPLELVVTASGKHKGNLQPGDFVRVDQMGKPVVEGQPRSSAETLLHVVAAQFAGANAVLHTHSIWSTLLSDHFYDQGGLWIEGFEMLKGLSGISTHEHREWVPIFENSQDIPQLAAQVTKVLENPESEIHAYLIRKHGMYTWGRDFAEALRHIEILEFLLECLGRQLSLGSN